MKPQDKHGGNIAQIPLPDKFDRKQVNLSSRTALPKHGRFEQKANIGWVFAPPIEFSFDNQAGHAKYPGGFCGLADSGLRPLDNC